MTVVNLIFTNFFSAFIDTDDCTPCIDRSFNPEELVEKICDESVDFGKIIKKSYLRYLTGKFLRGNAFKTSPRRSSIVNCMSIFKRICEI